MRRRCRNRRKENMLRSARKSAKRARRGLTLKFKYLNLAKSHPS